MASPGPDKIDLDTATAEEMQELNGIGPRIAQHLIDARETHGRLTGSLVRSVPGIRLGPDFWDRVEFSKSDQGITVDPSVPDARDLPSVHEEVRADGIKNSVDQVPPFVKTEEMSDPSMQVIGDIVNAIDNASLQGPPSARDDANLSPSSYVKEGADQMRLGEEDLGMASNQQAIKVREAETKAVEATVKYLQRGVMDDRKSGVGEDMFSLPAPRSPRKEKWVNRKRTTGGKIPQSNINSATGQSNMNGATNVDAILQVHASMLGLVNNMRDLQREMREERRQFQQPPVGLYHNPPAPRAAAHGYQDQAGNVNVPNRNGGQAGGNRQPTLMQLPKSLTYDGKGSWQAFFNKFERVAHIQRWTPQERKDYLCLSLTDKASEFFAMITSRAEDLAYVDIVEKFERRFGYKELPETAMITFNNAFQNRDESVDDWADRVLTLATRAFTELPDDYMTRQVILRFCLGSRDKEAGEKVANTRPASIEEAIDRIKYFMHTHNMVFGKQGKPIPQVSQISEEPKVEAVSTQPQSSARESRFDKFENRLTRLERKVESMIDKMEILFKQRNRSPSPVARRNPDESVCYSCNGRGHISRDCPKKSNRQTRRTPPNSPRSSPSRFECYNCGESGHIRPNCPKLMVQPQAEGKKQVCFTGKDDYDDLNTSGSD